VVLSPRVIPLLRLRSSIIDSRLKRILHQTSANSQTSLYHIATAIPCRRYSRYNCRTVARATEALAAAAELEHDQARAHDYQTY
jgi:hypothetical protein